LAYAYVFGAFNLFTNFDGAGGRFGDTGVGATTTDNAQSSVYASLDGTGRVIVLAINKQKTSASTATIQVNHTVALKTVSGVWRMAQGAATPASVPTTAVFRSGSNKFVYQMPAMSATVIVLTP
jgi:hypothetical protein